MLAIRAARLFDGEGADLIQNATVLVDGGCIVAVQSRGEAPEGAELVDLGEATLLPGLVDAHVHLAFNASADAVTSLTEATDDELYEHMRRAAAKQLAAGITTVRDLGDRGYLALRLRDELAADRTAGPRILAAGPPITTVRGHLWFLGGEAEGVEGVREAVREHASRGVDVIKIVASGGEMTAGTHSHEPQFGPDELRAAVEEARRLGLPVAAHAHATEAIQNAMAAGVDSIEHCSFITEEGVDDRPDVIEALAASGVTVSLTLGQLPGFAPPPRVAARVDGFTRGFRTMLRAGVAIVVGTDAGIAPPKPHDILPYGYLMLADVGMSTVDAMRAVTSGPARLLRLGDRKGRIAAGYDADLLAVAGDPIANPEAILDVRAVFREGHRIR